MMSIEVLAITAIIVFVLALMQKSKTRDENPIPGDTLYTDLKTGKRYIRPNIVGCGITVVNAEDVLNSDEGQRQLKALKELKLARPEKK